MAHLRRATTGQCRPILPYVDLNSVIKYRLYSAHAGSLSSPTTLSSVFDELHNFPSMQATLLARIPTTKGDLAVFKRAFVENIRVSCPYELLDRFLLPRFHSYHSMTQTSIWKILNVMQSDLPLLFQQSILLV